MVSVGICLVPFGVTYADLREAALTVEEVRFESVWTWDQMISFNSDTETVLECWSVLAALAEATSHVKLGSFVTNVMNRHPDVLAKVVSTAQQIAGGRIKLGIGAGDTPKDQLAFGRPFPSGQERVKRVGEAVEVMRLLWSGKSINYDGRYYKVRDGYCVPPPDPIPPVMVAGHGPVSARNAARVGDGWNYEGPWGRDDDEDSSKFRRLKRIVLNELGRLGRPREAFEISVSEEFDEGFRHDPLR
ncbi:MAG: LLM class flavin-dependent oxidoreductase, partial [Dehalococcoidia bacterium]